MDKMKVTAFVLQRISELRLQKGVSEKQMSREIGRSASYLSAMINNKSLSSLATLIEICDYLEVTLEEFFSADYENPVRVNRLVAQARRLTDEELDMLTHLAEHMNRLKEK
ncbi:Predicted transcriptional regulator [uncultured Clostridium sp.]|nr:Predicted transcriptional regulator [uncultured Clostridium sp.]